MFRVQLSGQLTISFVQRQPVVAPKQPWLVLPSGRHFLHDLNLFQEPSLFFGQAVILRRKKREIINTIRLSCQVVVSCTKAQSTKRSHLNNNRLQLSHVLPRHFEHISRSLGEPELLFLLHRGARLFQLLLGNFAFGTNDPQVNLQQEEQTNAVTAGAFFTALLVSNSFLWASRFRKVKGFSDLHVVNEMNLLSVAERKTGILSLVTKQAVPLHLYHCFSCFPSLQWLYMLHLPFFWFVLLSRWVCAENKSKDTFCLCKIQFLSRAAALFVVERNDLDTWRTPRDFKLRKKDPARGWQHSLRHRTLHLSSTIFFCVPQKNWEPWICCRYHWSTRVHATSKPILHRQISRVYEADLTSKALMSFRAARTCRGKEMYSVWPSISVQRETASKSSADSAAMRLWKAKGTPYTLCSINGQYSRRNRFTGMLQNWFFYEIVCTIVAHVRAASYEESLLWNAWI